MAYTRKTRDQWLVEGCYGTEWEILTYEDSRQEAREMLRCYDENEPQYPHRMRCKRVLVGE